MRTEVLQPWTTIQGSGSVTTITQEEECWADFSDSGAATFWLDVRSISGTVILQLASSPTKDESLFLPITIPVTLNPLTTPTPLTTVAGVTAQSGVTATFLAPLARWVRWSVSSSSGGVWNATFRIRASRSRTPYFSPTMAPGCQLWLRSDMGVVASGASVTGWDDLSGNGYAFPAVNTPLLVSSYSGFNGYPAIQLASASNAYFQSGSAGPAISQPNTILVVLQAAGAPANYQCYIAGYPSVSSQELSQTVSSSTSVNLNAGSGVNVSLVNPPNLALTTPSIIQVDWNQGSSQVWQNGYLQGTVSSSPGTDPMKLGTIGAFPGGGSQYFVGWYAEILIFNQILTPAWRTVVNRYLGARYAITVP
jgi:hypothetical protein